VDPVVLGAAPIERVAHTVAVVVAVGAPHALRIGRRARGRGRAGVVVVEHTIGIGVERRAAGARGVRAVARARSRADVHPVRYAITVGVGQRAARALRVGMRALSHVHADVQRIEHAVAVAVARGPLARRPWRAERAEPDHDAAGQEHRVAGVILGGGKRVRVADVRTEADYLVQREVQPEPDAESSARLRP
jgi:hypothetical protein